MDTEVAVAVVMPVYNAESTLKEALDSVLAQTFSNYILVAVNDGSRDKSGVILNDYASRSDKIIILNQANEGAGSSRNNGITKALNLGVKFIAFLDADDMYSKYKLEAQYDLLVNDNDLGIAVVRQEDVGNVASFDGNNYQPDRELPVIEVNNFLNMLCTNDFFFHPASVMIRADLFNPEYGYSTSKSGEDFQPFLYFSIINTKVKIIDKKLYYQRVLPNSLQRSIFATYHGYKARVDAISRVMADTSLSVNINDESKNILLSARDRFLTSMLYGARLDFGYLYTLSILFDSYGLFKYKSFFVKEFIKTVVYPLARLMRRVV
ncbi:glycosyltransferase family 2 protein [Acidihalobacter aeolianus]|uniref:glycosyltransferase family 2 protein n=1 Tax=Acidihalobacter aeolianus TaxID=2792603 RepID=UPI0009F3ECAE|nr:glycosyltransferase family 2 protein [Acidihalobacter aeolianus]